VQKYRNYSLVYNNKNIFHNNPHLPANVFLYLYFNATMKHKIFILIILNFCILCWGQGNNKLLIRELDETIKNRSLYQAEKGLHINELEMRLIHITDDEQRFGIYGLLFDEYRSYNTDSSLIYAHRKLDLSYRINNQSYIDNAKMNMAEALGRTGMYMEALDLMKDVKVKSGYYYHVYRTIYGLMADHAIREEDKMKYSDMTNLYRDTLLSTHKEDPVLYSLVKADQLIVYGEYQKAIEILDAIYKDPSYSTHTRAQLAYTYSEAYHHLGDVENEKKYLLVSSIADLKSSVKEYVSLRKLAMLVYNEGDVGLAYNYLKCSLEDATQCNARLRTLEILQLFPIIDKAYQSKVENQKQLMLIFLISISVLSVFLLVAVLFIYRQMKKVAAAWSEVTNANKQLKRLNEELNLYNRMLKDVNRNLSETNQIKEEYIGRYMDQCSAYLDKIDIYRRSLGKIASSGKVEELYKTIKSTQFIEEELKEFYAGFDDTFLRLFPTFVEDFNTLLYEKLYPKPGELLNTELRIFALIRLGITDSMKIAQFLRYSVTTIYNYRTRVRNRALDERDDFENKVMKIGYMPQ